MSQLGLAIKWPADQLHRIRKRYGVVLKNRPEYFLTLGGLVAVMTSKRDVAMTFTAAGIDGPRRVKFATGNTGEGYFLRARPGSIRAPSPEYQQIQLPGWHAEGAFRYFDPETRHLITVGSRSRDTQYIDDDKSISDDRYKALPFQHRIPGRSRGAPESALVRAYVSWIGDSERFEHRYISADRLYTDLFDRRKWRLFEAKAKLSRHALRTAVGQLLDYRRFFRRSPSVGVLLPERPTKSSLVFLDACRVTVVWRTPSGQFNDSRDGTWTRFRRVL
jgi:hypothetical protein